MNLLEERCLKISFEQRLSHLGSVLTALPIIDSIYRKMKKSDKFVLSSGHAGLALYVVLEKYFGVNAEKLLEEGGIHPTRKKINTGVFIDCSTGSLGNGLPIALGMALADRKRKVYCLISDGESAEGSIWESLRIKVDNHVDNLEVHLNVNGWGAYDPIDSKLLIKRIKSFDPKVIIHKTTVPDWDFLTDPQEAHYKALNYDEYKKVMGIKTLTIDKLKELYKKVMS